MENRKIAAVTGANGFVGSHLVDLLLDKDNEVRCITRKTSNLRWLEGKPVTNYDCGLFDKEGLKDALRGVNVLYHVAGVVKAKTNEGYLKGNVESTRNLLDVVLEVNPDIDRVIIISSQAACGPSSEGKTITEDSIPNPLTRYGKSKLAQEKLALEYADRLPITIIRPPAVYGERDTEIYLVFKTYKMGLMTLIGFDKKEVSLIHVKDLVEGIYLAAINERAVNEIYFISSVEFYNWKQVGKIIGKHMGRKALSVNLPHFIVYTVAVFAQFFSMFSSKAATFNIEKARDFVQKYWTCDTTKAVEQLGYRQKISLDEGMKRTIEWYREMKWL